MRLVPILAFAALMLSPVAANAALVFKSMGVEAESYVSVKNDTYRQDNYKSDFSLTFKGTRTANTSANVNRTGASGSASSKVTGTFASATQGSVQFTPQTASMAVTDPAMLEAFAYAYGTFTYNFQLTTAMYLTYDHSIATTGTQVDGTAFGQWFHIDKDGGASTPFSQDWFSGTHAGTILLAPGNYSMVLQPAQLNWSYFTATTGAGSNQTSLTSSFTYSFSNSAPVPEPAALGLLGLGVLALASRRRRR